MNSLLILQGYQSCSAGARKHWVLGGPWKGTCGTVGLKGTGYKESLFPHSYLG